jgi:hypothetical protein
MWPMAENKVTLDRMVEAYNEMLLFVERDEKNLARLRLALIKRVLKDGRTPSRAVKTLSLSGEKWEARVTRGLEVTVDTKLAELIKLALRAKGKNRLFRKLFRTVVTYVLAGGAEKFTNRQKLPEGAPRNLRSLFARAIQVRELAPQLEVRKRGKDDKAA